jgi:23S rRNA (cytosine1962-C5)-methyltransferase
MTDRRSSTPPHRPPPPAAPHPAARTAARAATGAATGAAEPRAAGRTTDPTAAPPLAVDLVETAGWDDYALLDSGSGRKLERYGRITVVRPEEQALWTPRLAASAWEAADAVFTGDVEQEGPGRWQFNGRQPESWPMRFGEATFGCRFTSFRHVGVFPEQAAHWTWMTDRLQGRARPRLLNLFGYTGVASLLAAAGGAEVTHVDASKKAIAWARENQAASGLDGAPIRWICEDAMRYVGREVKRGSRYDAIVLDPPKYGRGPAGEVWDLFESLPTMLAACRQLLTDRPLFVILTVYAMRASFVSFHELMREAMPKGALSSGELLLVEQSGGRRLATSLFCRWEPTP